MQIRGFAKFNSVVSIHFSVDEFDMAEIRQVELGTDHGDGHKITSNSWDIQNTHTYNRYNIYIPPLSLSLSLSLFIFLHVLLRLCHYFSRYADVILQRLVSNEPYTATLIEKSSNLDFSFKGDKA